MAGKDNGDGRVSDWPNISENGWYVLAITSAIFTLVAVVIAFLCIFLDGFDADRDVKMGQALAPFGVALFALVTFCTASWRGSINARQANQAENEGRAKLLQEGAKLLSESTKPSHVSAGVASLGVLIDSGEVGYAQRAMNLLADFVEDHMQNTHINRHRDEIYRVMRSGDNSGFNTRRDVTFYVPEREDDDPYDYDVVYWKYIPGFASISYYDGEFSLDGNYNINDLENVSFSGVRISEWGKLNIDHRFVRCSFISCSIASISSIDSVNHNNNYKYSFSDCDFSNCVISDERLFAIDLMRGGNYFRAGNPPKLADKANTADWSALLHCRG